MPLSALAEKRRVSPRLIDAVGVGANSTTAGTPKPGVGAALVPQPTQAPNDAMTVITDNMNARLPMQLPARRLSAGEIASFSSWPETLSLVAEVLFSN